MNCKKIIKYDFTIQSYSSFSFLNKFITNCILYYRENFSDSNGTKENVH